MGETKERKKKAKAKDPDDPEYVKKKKKKKEKKAKRKSKKEREQSSSEDEGSESVRDLVGTEDDETTSISKPKSKKSLKKKSSKPSKSSSSTSLTSYVEDPHEVKDGLLDAGPAAYPTENAKKYGDLKDPKIKKQCKRVYKLLNFDPWNEAHRYDDDDTCDYLLENPEPCDVKFEFEGFSGCIYPLSMCYALKASRDTVEAAYDAFPPAIKETDLWVGTPYHYAGAYVAPPESVQFLIQKDPTGIEVVNYYGRTALHMGALFKAPRKSMELLCNKYPTAARIKDKDGYTPLHLACENGAEAGVVDLLVNACPKVVYAAAQHTEMTPIHLASSKDADIGVIRVLLEAATDSSICKLTDMLGHTPLHMALLGLASYDVIALLLTSCPETVWIKTNTGELPLEIAQRKRASGEVLEMLENLMERLLVENGND